METLIYLICTKIHLIDGHFLSFFKHYDMLFMTNHASNLLQEHYVFHSQDSRPTSTTHLPYDTFSFKNKFFFTYLGQYKFRQQQTQQTDDVANNNDNIITIKQKISHKYLFKREADFAQKNRMTTSSNRTFETNDNGL